MIYCFHKTPSSTPNWCSCCRWRFLCNVKAHTFDNPFRHNTFFSLWNVFFFKHKFFFSFFFFSIEKTNKLFARKKSLFLWPKPIKFVKFLFEFSHYHHFVITCLLLPSIVMLFCYISKFCWTFWKRLMLSFQNFIIQSHLNVEF